MSSESKLEKVSHPYISVVANVKSGNPVITGTSTKVMDIAIRYELLGMTPDEIIEQFPHLTLAQIHDALSYYYENKSKLDENYRKDQILISELKRLYPSRMSGKFG